MLPPEFHIRCVAPITKSGGDEVLRLEINGKPFGVKLRISQLNRQMVAGLPKRALDLLELAGLVYGVDAAISRGGSTDQQMGRKWHRRFVVEMPVRDLDFWQSTGVPENLEETLMFLSGDRFVFTFIQKRDEEAERNRFFKFDGDSAWQATRVLMFSGGLDSFAGALEEIAEQRQRVALVSHFSASKIAPVQRDLRKALAKKFGDDSCRHIPVQVQMTGRGLKEGTHRGRSFLFAVLGAITAQAFELDRVSFYENGVVSLNLPPVGNVLGTRATRTTHPQTLTRFSAFFAKIFDGEMRIDNPFFWRTKKDVIETVARLNMKDHIARTRSCADVHNQTRQYPHCGRCSQCIDRRFAVLAAGLERFDPEEAYRFALMEDARHGAIDREIALSYVRNAQAFEHMTPVELERHFPAVIDAIRHLDHPPESALSMIAQLLKRHGIGVSGVMQDTLSKRDMDDFADGSLPRLYGDAQKSVVLPMITMPETEKTTQESAPVGIEFDEDRRTVIIEERITIARNASADLLVQLCKAWLEGAGKGLPKLDFPCVSALELAERLGLEGDEAVRRRVLNARNLFDRKIGSCGMVAPTGIELIENVPWHGYRLNPDQVVIRKCKVG